MAMFVLLKWYAACFVPSAIPFSHAESCSMTHSSTSTITPGDFLDALLRRPFRWIAPAVLLAAAAAVFAVVQQETWEVAQALIVRDEAVFNQNGPGKFGHSDQRKTLQETVLEIVKSAGVLEAALKRVGPPAEYEQPELWPTPKDVAGLRSTINVAPPKGAEFGLTEVFYLKVKAPSRERGVELASAVCAELETRLQQLREARAQSMSHELEKTVLLAEADLREATARLGELEHQAGSDLAELRMLNESSSGDSVLRRKAVEIENELRQAQTLYQQHGQFLEVLRSAQDSPGRLLASPAALLGAHPALGRLKDALMDAQFRTANISGILTEIHPSVKAARAAEAEIGRQIEDELRTAISSAEIDVKLTADRIRRIEGQLEGARERLEMLAGLRAEYSIFAANAQHRSHLLALAQSDLAEARAGQAGALAASLINRIDGPDGGTKPVNPGASVLIPAGFAGGLFLGFAIVFLTAQPAGAGRAARAVAPAEAGDASAPLERDHGVEVPFIPADERMTFDFLGRLPRACVERVQQTLRTAVAP